MPRNVAPTPSRITKADGDAIAGPVLGAALHDPLPVITILEQDGTSTVEIQGMGCNEQPSHRTTDPARDGRRNAAILLERPRWKSA
jgi:hypothetical protein